MHRLIILFLLNFTSGIPFLLILSTLSVWLLENGIAKKDLVWFSLATIPYAAKFLLVPLTQRYLPFFCHDAAFRRKYWLIWSQVGLVVGIWLLGNCDATQSFASMIALTCSIGFFSALQDLLVETYRIEALPTAQIAIGSTIAALGYRVGMICSGVIAIYLAAYLKSWRSAYHIMSSLIVIGILASCAMGPSEQITSIKLNNYLKSYQHFKSQHADSLFRIMFIILVYKLIDSMLHTASIPLLLNLGFNKLEIANIAKSFGMIWLVIGNILGAIIIKRFNLNKSLIAIFALQFGSAFCFLVQTDLGYNKNFLFITMGVENLATGIGQVVFISYLTHLCVKPFAPHHFILLSSLASLTRVLSAATTNIILHNASFQQFYWLVISLALFTTGKLVSKYMQFKANYEH